MQMEGNGPPRTILLTSANPQEGKSAVAEHLADTIAQAGYRTLIVDCDLRIPRMHKAFNLPNARGLTSVLGANCTPEEAIQTSRTPGVSVLTSGPLPPNPAELLASPEMGQLLTEVAKRYDVVLLDSPAMLAVTDAVILAAKVDGVMLVVARGKARRQTVQKARELLAKAKVLGVIVSHGEFSGTYYHYAGKHAKQAGEAKAALAAAK
jgi:capsular exopolysaccharide synthesis family protein